MAHPGKRLGEGDLESVDPRIAIEPSVAVKASPRSASQLFAASGRKNLGEGNFGMDAVALAKQFDCDPL